MACGTSTVRFPFVLTCVCAVTLTRALLCAGIFQQLIAPDGSQLEAPDPWLVRDNPWELPRADVAYQIRFYGHAERVEGMKAIWQGGQEVLAMAYDTMIPGYDTKNTNNLRLWESRPKRGFDLQSFNGAWDARGT